MRILVIKAIAFICVLSFFSFKSDKKSKYLVFRCQPSFEKYNEESWVSPKDSIYFAGTKLDSALTTDKQYYPYEQFRVYCDTTKHEGDKYYWAVQVRCCTYMDRSATYYLGTEAGKYKFSLGRQKADSHCHLTTFGAMLPISPNTKTVWLKVEDIDYHTTN